MTVRVCVYRYSVASRSVAFCVCLFRRYISLSHDAILVSHLCAQAVFSYLCPSLLLVFQMVHVLCSQACHLNFSKLCSEMVIGLTPQFTSCCCRLPPKRPTATSEVFSHRLSPFLCSSVYSVLSLSLSTAHSSCKPSCLSSVPSVSSPHHLHVLSLSALLSFQRVHVSPRFRESPL